VAVSERFLPAPPERVFEVISDPTTYPEWLVGAKRIRGLDPDFPREGASFDHTVGAGPLDVKDTTTVERKEGERVLQLIARARPLLSARVRFEVSEAPDGSRLRITEHPVGVFRFFAPLFAPLIKKRNDLSLAQLERYLREHGR
jgi:hypothetical protein